MRTSLLELESLGILAATGLPREYDWMLDSDKQLVVDMLLSQGRFSKREVARREKQAPDCAMRLTAYGLAEWETDKCGKPACLVLSPRGEELGDFLLKVARTLNRLDVTFHAHRAPAAA